MKGAVLAGALLLAATGCSAGAAASQPAEPQAGNVRVCEHYRTQRAWVLSLAKPTIADAMKAATWVAADAAEATPGTALARDLNAMSADQQHLTSTDAAVRRVHADCRALGIDITR